MGKGPALIGETCSALFSVRIVEHVDAVGRERELEQRAREAAAGLDQREEALGRHVEALEDALHEQE